MNKNVKYILWLLFLIIIPAVYIAMKVLIPNASSIEFVITIGSYLIAIFSLMYKVDIKFYFFIQSILIHFKYTSTSWTLSARYNSVVNENLTQVLIDFFVSVKTKIIKREENFVCMLWDSRNLLNIRIDDMEYGNKTIHLYTSKIDVPIKDNKKKIKELSSLLEKFENKLAMVDRDDKRYEMDIEYAGKSPFYSYWIKSLPEEKIYQFNCLVKIDDKDETIGVNKNCIHIKSVSFSDLFQRIDNYLTLRNI